MCRLKNLAELAKPEEPVEQQDDKRIPSLCGLLLSAQSRIPVSGCRAGQCSILHRWGIFSISEPGVIHREIFRLYVRRPRQHENNRTNFRGVKLANEAVQAQRATAAPPGKSNKLDWGSTWWRLDAAQAINIRKRQTPNAKRH